jgi:4-amino-4-deoxychorismate lyase
LIIDGQQRDWVQADDRGLTYGDGLFETIAVRDGKAQLWNRHMRRLAQGCSRLGIPPPDARQLAEEASVEIRGVDVGVLKIIITRGRGGRGYRPPACPRPTRILELTGPPGYPGSWRRRGIRARYCETRLSRNPCTAGIKHLGRLEQVLARNEWGDPEIPEGVMLDTRGQVIEGTMTNLFVLRHSRLMTPELSHSGVTGVMRELVMDLARGLGMEVSEVTLTPMDLEGADALFSTSSLIGIWPIRELGGREYNIGAIPRGLLETAWACALTY